MDRAEFGKFWNVVRTAYPAAAARTENDTIRRVWEAALQPYRLTDCTQRALACARESKYLPDIADITAGLTVDREANRDRYYEAAVPYLEQVQQAAAAARERTRLWELEQALEERE